MLEHRILLIGHGTISQKYREALSKLEAAEIVGVAGRNEERVRAYAEAAGIAAWGVDIADTARRCGATAAIICTPNASHYTGVMEAAAAGLHILCEKPLHIDPDKQREMIDACERSGVQLAVSYMRRFTPHIRMVKDFIDSGALGRITVLDVTLKHYRNAAYYDSWHGTREIDGGGPFMQQGSHMIDLANWLGGGFEEVLSANLFQIAHDIETEDHGYAVIRYKGGAVGLIEASTGCLGTSSDRIELTGANGSITLDFDGIQSWNVPGVEQPQPAEEDASTTLFDRLCADFLRSIELGRRPLVDGREGQADNGYL
jgi:UDP-N-acetyl-2-amino-2-deoxyglucuronate dehydrogenase